MFFIVPWTLGRPAAREWRETAAAPGGTAPTLAALTPPLSLAAGTVFTWTVQALALVSAAPTAPVVTGVNGIAALPGVATSLQGAAASGNSSTVSIDIEQH